MKTRWNRVKFGKNHLPSRSQPKKRKKVKEEEEERRRRRRRKRTQSSTNQSDGDQLSQLIATDDPTDRLVSAIKRNDPARARCSSSFSSRFFFFFSIGGHFSFVPSLLLVVLPFLFSMAGRTADWPMNGRSSITNDIHRACARRNPVKPSETR